MDYKMRSRITHILGVVLGLITITLVLLFVSNKEKFGSFNNATPSQALPFTITTNGNGGSATTTNLFGDLLPQNTAYNLGSTSTPWNTLFVGSVSTTGSVPDNFSSLTWVNATGGSLAITGTATTTFGGPVSSTQFLSQGALTGSSFQASTGTGSVPSFNFTSAPGTGVYQSSINALAFATAATGRWFISSAGDFAPLTNLVGNLGRPANLVKDLYLGGSIYATQTNQGLAAFSSTTTNATTTGAFAMTNLTTGSGSLNGICITAANQFVQEASCVASSARFKEHIASLSSSDLLSELMKLNAVSFDWRDEHLPSNGVDANSKASTGFIAEEVALIDPMLVVYTDKYTPEDLAFEKKNYPKSILTSNGKVWIPQSVDYGRISYLTVGAIQAQQKEIEDLKYHVDFIDRVIAWIKTVI